MGWFNPLQGNANAFRILTHQFEGRRKGGFVMTYSTLASIVKYLFLTIGRKEIKIRLLLKRRGWLSENSRELGIIRLSKPDEPLRYARHPLVYLVEAADDICYQMMDIEDAHKLKLLTHDETKGLYMQFFDEKRRKRIEEVCRIVTDVNEQIAYLRSSVIGTDKGMHKSIYWKWRKDIDRGIWRHPDNAHLQSIERGLWQLFCNCLSKNISFQRCAGHRIGRIQVISTLIDLMINAVRSPEKAYSQLLINAYPDGTMSTHLLYMEKFKPCWITYRAWQTYMRSTSTGKSKATVCRRYNKTLSDASKMNPVNFICTDNVSKYYY